MNNKTINGGCFCRRIRYEAINVPSNSVICYCEDCRRSCGSQSVAWIVFSLSDFKFKEGKPKEFESSPGVIRTFCDHCGTSLTYKSKKRPGKIDVTTASLDNPDLYPPEGLVYSSKKLDWDICLDKQTILDET